MWIKLDVIRLSSNIKNAEKNRNKLTSKPGVTDGSLILRKLRTRLKVPGTPPSCACCRLLYTVLLMYLW